MSGFERIFKRSELRRFNKALEKANQQTSNAELLTRRSQGQACDYANRMVRWLRHGSETAHTI